MEINSGRRIYDVSPWIRFQSIHAEISYLMPYIGYGMWGKGSVKRERSQNKDGAKKGEDKTNSSGREVTECMTAQHNEMR